MNSKSQLGADKWVLSKFEKEYCGLFIDVGAADGFEISNTLLLELNGWKGIAIDAFPRNFKRRTNTVVEQAVLSSQKDNIVEFMIPTAYRDFSGIKSKLGKHKEALEKIESHTVQLKTSLIEDILAKHNVPYEIDYVNLDIEGSEYDVLSTFPFYKYKIKYLTVEHNFEEPKRTMIYDLLQKNGYLREKEVEWDDWYCHKSTQ
jgi:FkbM family methyltransferase